MFNEGFAHQNKAFGCKANYILLRMSKNCVKKKFLLQRKHLNNIFNRM
jgi:hypothetical protein